MRKINFLTS